MCHLLGNLGFWLQGVSVGNGVLAGYLWASSGETSCCFMGEALAEVCKAVNWTRGSLL